MARLTAADFDQELLILFDAYVHGDVDRRGFLERAQKFAVGGLSAAGLLAALSPDFASAQVIAPTDARIQTGKVRIDSPQGHGTVQAYVARPAGRTGRLPGVLIIHENRGLNPHIEDIARRLAVDGYLAMAPDALTPLGGYPGDEDQARDLFAKLDQKKTFADFLAVAATLKAHADCTGRMGAVGFCYGGGIVQRLAVELPDLAAGVPFYGPLPAADKAAQVKAPLLMHFAEHDARINAAWPTYEAALKAAGVAHTAYTYAGTQHGFNNDTTPRFDAAAAKLAWSRTMAFFDQHVRS